MISNVSMYYGTHSEPRVKSYCRFNLLGGCIFNFECLDKRNSIGHPSKKLFSLDFAQCSVFNFERLDILLDLIGHPGKKLLSFEFARSFFTQF